MGCINKLCDGIVYRGTRDKCGNCGRLSVVCAERICRSLEAFAYNTGRFTAPDKACGEDRFGVTHPLVGLYDGRSRFQAFETMREAHTLEKARLAKKAAQKTEAETAAAREAAARGGMRTFSWHYPNRAREPELGDRVSLEKTFKSAEPGRADEVRVVEGHIFCVPTDGYPYFRVRCDASRVYGCAIGDMHFIRRGPAIEAAPEVSDRFAVGDLVRFENGDIRRIKAVAESATLSESGVLKKVKVYGSAAWFWPIPLVKIDAKQEPLRVGDRVRSQLFGGWLRVYDIRPRAPRYMLPDGRACFRDELELDRRDA